MKISCNSPSVSDEQKAQLLNELEEYERDHSGKHETRSKPDYDDDLESVSTQGPDTESEVDGDGSFLCVMKKQGRNTLNALRAAQDLAECLSKEHSSDQDQRAEKVKSRFTTYKPYPSAHPTTLCRLSCLMSAASRPASTAVLLLSGCTADS